MTQIATLAGLIDLARPDPARLTPAMLAASLSKLNRWLGHTSTPLSVAQHSLMVANQLPRRARIYGLLHDAHEALIGDIATPVETYFEFLHPGFRNWLTRTKADLDAAIRRSLGVPTPSNAILGDVFEADARMAATEWLRLIPDVNGRREGTAKPYTIPVRLMSWPDAEATYLMALTEELELKGWEA